jgi:hypothetical protein
MKSQLTSTKKLVTSTQDVLFILIACVGFMIAVTFYSTELIDIVQQIEPPSSGQDELLTAIPAM